MKKELRWSQAGVETVLDETFGGRNFGMSLKVRQCPILETVWHTLTVQGLLPNTSNHLRYVDERAFGSGRTKKLNISKFQHNFR